MLVIKMVRIHLVMKITKKLHVRNGSSAHNFKIYSSSREMQVCLDSEVQMVILASKVFLVNQAMMGNQDLQGHQDHRDLPALLDHRALKDSR